MHTGRPRALLPHFSQRQITHQRRFCLGALRVQGTSRALHELSGQPDDVFSKETVKHNW